MLHRLFAVMLFVQFLYLAPVSVPQALAYYLRFGKIQEFSVDKPLLKQLETAEMIEEQIQKYMKYTKKRVIIWVYIELKSL